MSDHTNARLQSLQTERRQMAGAFRAEWEKDKQNKRKSDERLPRISPRCPAGCRTHEKVMNTKTGSSGKLETLMQRQAAVAAAVRTEKEKRKAIARKEHDRFTRIVGQALVASAGQTPEVAATLKGILRNTRLPESDRKFLQSKAWL